MSTEELKSELQARLTGKVVVLCVGSRMRGDDMFGPLVAKRIAGKVAAEVIDAENVPENYLGKIAKLAPDQADLMVRNFAIAMRLRLMKAHERSLHWCFNRVSGEW